MIKTWLVASIVALLVILEIVYMFNKYFEFQEKQETFCKEKGGVFISTRAKNYCIGPNLKEIKMP